jgi:hypothetical protein
MRRRMAGSWLLGALACGGEGTLGSEEALARWRESAPQQYVARSCGEGFSARSCTVTSVDSGEPVETLVQDWSGSWQPAETPVDVVEGILSASTQDTDGCKRRVESHPAYAFPERVYFDCGEEGWGLRITCFEAGTLDLARCQ